MTVVRYREREPLYAISLYKDLRKTKKIEPPLVVTITETSYLLPSHLSGSRIASLYEWSGSAWVKIPSFRRSRRYLLLGSVPSGQVMIVPKSSISLLQSSTKGSEPLRVYPAVQKGYTVENIVITTLDDETAAPGPFLFSETENGTYTDTLNLSSLPTVFYVKSKLTAVGLKETVPLIITSDVYL